jgi:hypothetical protein
MRWNWGKLVAVCVVAACGGKQISSGNEGQGGDAPGVGGVGNAANQPSNDAGSALASGNGGINAGGHVSVGGKGDAGGSGGAGGRGGATAGGPPQGPPHLECQSPTMLSGGFSRCGNGFVHRAAPGVCPNEIEPSTEPAGGAGGDRNSIPAGGNCASTADCPDDPLVYCTRGNGQCGESSSGECRRGCVQDGDCGSGRICLCGNALLVGKEPIGRCVKASCKTDSDCKPGFLCVSSPGDDWEPSFSCQSPADECGGDADCPEANEGGGPSLGSACTTVQGKRACAVPFCGP